MWQASGASRITTHGLASNPMPSMNRAAAAAIAKSESRSSPGASRSEACHTGAAMSGRNAMVSRICNTHRAPIRGSVTGMVPPITAPPTWVIPVDSSNQRCSSALPGPCRYPAIPPGPLPAGWRGWVRVFARRPTAPAAAEPPAPPEPTATARPARHPPKIRTHHPTDPTAKAPSPAPA